MQFNNGDLVERIIFSDGNVIISGIDCTSIMVSMENGQMAGVPWFECWKDGVLESKWNGALVSGVYYT